MKLNLKKLQRKFAAVTIVSVICVTTFATVSGERMRESTEYGRMIAVTSVTDTYAEADMNLESSGIKKISYDDMLTLDYENKQLADIESTEKKYDELTLAKEMEEKDKAALEALLKAEKEKKAQEEKAKKEAAQTAYVAGDVPPQTTDTTAITAYVPGTASGTYLGQFVTTAYCGCSRCCGHSTGITASGTQATEGRTIATSKQFSFGTQLVINGNVYTVEDRGGAIKGNRIDIFFNSHEAAIQYGRRTVDVYAY